MVSELQCWSQRRQDGSAKDLPKGPASPKRPGAGGSFPVWGEKIREKVQQHKNKEHINNEAANSFMGQKNLFVVVLWNGSIQRSACCEVMWGPYLVFISNPNQSIYRLIGFPYPNFMLNHKHYILTTSAVDGLFPPRHPHSSTPLDKLKWSLASHRHRSPLPPPKNGPARPVVGGVVGDPRDLQFQHIWRRVLHDQLISPLFLGTSTLYATWICCNHHWNVMSFIQPKFDATYPTTNLIRLKPTWLVVEPTHLKKYARQIGSWNPKDQGETKTYLSCHHLETNGMMWSTKLSDPKLLKRQLAQTGKRGGTKLAWTKIGRWR